MRAIVNRGFTPRRIAELEPRIRAIARGCLAEARRKGELDLVADLAIPLPVTVIAELLGVDPDRRADFKRWSDTIVASAAGGGMPGAANPGALTAFAELFSYLASVIEERRRAPREDLVSILVRAEDGAAALKPAEVVMFALLLLVAGNETTTNLLGNALLALTEHPGRARARPARARAGAGADRGGAALRLAGAARAPRGHPRHGARRGSRSRRARSSRRCSARRTATTTRSRTPTASTSTASARRTSRSASACTSAWAPRSRGWRRGSRSRSCSSCPGLARKPTGRDRAGRLVHAARPAQPAAAFRGLIRARKASARSAPGTPPRSGTSARRPDRRRRSRLPSRA